MRLVFAHGTDTGSDRVALPTRMWLAVDYLEALATVYVHGQRLEQIRTWMPIPAAHR